MSDALETEIWQIPLAVEFSLRQRAVLSDSERDRAERFRFDDDRRRYVVAHAATRSILGQRLSVSPELLQFTAGQFGKPELIGGGDLQFNLSHSGDLALLAVTHGAAVGVDVEQLDRVRRGGEAIERFLSARERHDLAQLSGNERETALARLWVCKEAWLKATGEGLSRPLDSFDMAFDGGQPRVAAVRPYSADAVGWTMSLLELNEPYTAALAVRAVPIAISLRSWTPSS